MMVVVKMLVRVVVKVVMMMMMMVVNGGEGDIEVENGGKSECLMIISCFRVVTNGQTNNQTDIGDCRVAIMTEKYRPALELQWPGNNVTWSSLSSSDTSSMISA